MMTATDALSPEEIAKVSFENKRRGYDPSAVDAHLKSAAATVTGLQDEVVILNAKVDALTAQVDAAKQAAEDAAQSPLEFDDQELIDRIGVEAARVLSDARTTASERLSEADTEARQIRAQAEKLFAERSEQADVEAQRIRAKALEDADAKALEAEASAELIISSAQADMEVARSEVGIDRESLDAEAAAIIREAEVARRQILGDLLRRRGAAKRQIEQLRAGRERLLQSHETVRRALDEITEELSISMSEARAAANAAGHSISDGSIEEIEAELEAARMAGLLDTGYAPVRSPALPTSTPAASPATGTESEPAPTEAVGATDALDADDADEILDAESDRGAGAGGDADEIDAIDLSDEAAAEVEGDSGDRANVVALDSARADVDTGSHPANRRVAKSEASADELPEEANSEDDSVDLLFATLHDASDAPAPKKSTGKKQAKSVKKSPKKKANHQTKVALVDPPATNGSVAGESLVDAAALARRLKRVLADEQSRVMSTIKHAEVVPDLDAVLFTAADQRSGYWNEVLDQLDDPERAGTGATKAIDELVDTIRRRVGDALRDGDGDAETILASLRGIYRGIKTQQIGQTADAVAGSMLVTT